MSFEIKSADMIDGLRKGLEVIHAFDDSVPELTQSEIAQRVHLSRAAARRYLLTLTALGYVATDGKHFWLTPKVMQIGHSYSASARLPRTVLPELRAMTDECGESTNFAVLEGTQAVYVCCAHANRLLSTAIQPGTRLPGYASTAGRLIASYLDPVALDRWITDCAPKPHTTHTTTNAAKLKLEIQSIKRQGYGVTESQFEYGLRGISVPVLNGANDLIGAISVSMAISAMPTATAIQTFVPMLSGVASRLVGKL